MSNSLLIMNTVLLGLSLSILLPCGSVVAEPQNAEGKLTFHLSGFDDNSGQAILKLFRKADSVPSRPFIEVKAEIINNESNLSVDNLPYGEYAAILVHDKNGNGIIDHKFGIPAEPLRYTNNWHLSLFSGMPTFEKLKFLFSPSNNSIEINMQKLIAGFSASHGD